jgi:hypothetical protein
MKTQSDPWRSLLPETRLCPIGPVFIEGLRRGLRKKRHSRGRGTNCIRALRPIEPLMVYQAAQRARAARRSVLRGEVVDMTWMKWAVHARWYLYYFMYGRSKSFNQGAHAWCSTSGRAAPFEKSTEREAQSERFFDSLSFSGLLCGDCTLKKKAG